MTAEARPMTSRFTLDDDARQLIAVVAVLAVALLAAIGLRLYVEGQTRTVTSGGVTASIPQAWIYQPAAGNVLFTAVDPRNPGQRYSVSRLTPTGAVGLAQTVDQRVGAESQLLNDFQVLSREPVTVGSRTGESVTYTYVSTQPGQVPQAIEGRDLYLPGTSGVLVINVESPARTFDRAGPAFDRFAASVGG